jgi:hypothetical protein
MPPTWEPFMARHTTWQVGPHKFGCYDLVEEADQIRGLGQPTLMYTDPPWGDAPATGFRRRAGIEDALYSWTLLYKTLLTMWDIPMFIESGNSLCADIDQLGGPHESWPITYAKGKNPSRLHYFGPQWDGPDFAGFDDAKTPLMVLNHVRPVGTVLEPCVGYGTTAFAAISTGWTLLANDLVPERCEWTVMKASRILGEKPFQIA